MSRKDEPLIGSPPMPTLVLHLRRRFIAKRTRASNDADIARQIDLTGHDAEQ
jgi:hypothetical protein